MSRQVRRVPKDWEHPVENGRYKPLHGPEMPDPNHVNCSHYQMYETTSEGTPISPVMETPEELATWLVENKASAFAGQSASYEAWLQVCHGRSTITGVVTAGKFVSGAEYQMRNDRAFVSNPQKGYGYSS